MNLHSGETKSVWMETAERPDFKPLEADLRTDVCIVGAGIVGLTTAYLLCKGGRQVVVLDDGPIVSGETERTTAHLSNALDDRYFHLAKMHGEKGAHLAAQSHTAAIYKIEEIIKNENIDCDFCRLDGYLFVPSEESYDILEKELKAAHNAGLPEVHFVDRVPWTEWDTGKALVFPNQAQFHALKYMSGLAKAITKMGGAIYTMSRVACMEGGKPAIVKTEDGFMVAAHDVVVATNTPINDFVVMHTKQAAYRTYVIGAKIPKGSIPLGLYWDTPDPYHYVRLHSTEDGDTDIVIIGGEDHKVGQEQDGAKRFENLEKWGRERFPRMQDVVNRWSGQIIEPNDGMAFIGHNPADKNNVYIATGDSGNGMTHGTIAGMLLTDLIQGRENPWTELYDPARINIGGIKDFISENANVVAQYADWIGPGEVSDTNKIPVGSGAVIRDGLHKVAVYRDENNELQCFSAKCTHLGCVVSWNPTENSWDCPCHGSRFDKLGNVMNGPAIKALQPIEK